MLCYFKKAGNLDLKSQIFGLEKALKKKNVQSILYKVIIEQTFRKCPPKEVYICKELTFIWKYCSIQVHVRQEIFFEKRFGE